MWRLTPLTCSGTACQPGLRTRSAVLLSCGRSTQSRTVCEADRRPLNGERAPCQAASEAAAEPPVAEPGKTGMQGGQRLAAQGRSGPRGSLPQREGGGLGADEATTRRGGVDRLAATLLYADRNTRMSSLRRRSPLTPVVRLVSGPAGCSLGKVRTGIFPAPAALRRIVDIVDSLPADREARMVADLYPSSWCHQAVISPQRNPASSRATAAATTLFTFLRAASLRNLPHRRTCAAQARSRVAGGQRSWARRIRSPT